MQLLLKMVQHTEAEIAEVDTTIQYLCTAAACSWDMDNSLKNNPSMTDIYIHSNSDDWQRCR